MSSQGLSASHSPLATAHQAEVERTALGLLQRPDIKLAHLQAKAPVSYTHLRAHETVLDLVCRLLLEKKREHDFV
mgnify:CR=1 FL=1